MDSSFQFGGNYVNSKSKLSVSILVLMDSSFQFYMVAILVPYVSGFNPCFNGFFFSIPVIEGTNVLAPGFNPCFNGFFFSIISIIPENIPV